jgi:hypothetical protein
MRVSATLVTEALSGRQRFEGDCRNGLRIASAFRARRNLAMVWTIPVFRRSSLPQMQNELGFRAP